MDDDVTPAEAGQPQGEPDEATIARWRAEPHASASEVAEMTAGRPEHRRPSLKAIRTRLDRGSLGSFKLGNIRMIPRSEAIRVGLVTEAEWPTEGGTQPQPAAAPSPQAAPQAAAEPLTAAQQPAIIDMGEIVETVARLSAQAAEGRLLTAQAGERERQQVRERQLLEETIHELRTTNQALEQQRDMATERADRQEARAQDLAAKLAACQQQRAQEPEGEEVAEVGEGGGTIRRATAGGGSSWWGRLVGRSAVQ